MRRTQVLLAALWACAAAAVMPLVAPAPAAAEPLAPAATGEDAPRARTTFGSHFGAARLREDWYLELTPDAHVVVPNLKLAGQGALFESEVRGDLRLAIAAPLMIRVKDRPPEDELPPFRRELWDEPSEYLRVVRWLEVGAPFGGIYLRAGELPDVRVGHRTIVDAYDNSFDADHFQWGLHAALNTVFGGVDAFVDEVVQPDILGLRAYLRPLAFRAEPAAGRRLAVGASLVADQAAPTALVAGDTGIAQTPEGDVAVAAARPTALVGWDVEYTAVQTDTVSLTPFVDANTHLGIGSGMHSGAFAGLRPAPDLVIDLRAEYRLAGPGYLPAYVGRLYEVERQAYLRLPGGALRSPKVVYADAVDDALRHGHASEVGLNLRDRVFLLGGWSDLTGRDNDAAWVQVRLPELGPVQLGVSFVNSRFEGARELVDLDDALVIVEARVSPLPWLYADGSLRRRWEVGVDGSLVPTDDIWFGAGVSFGTR